MEAGLVSQGQIDEALAEQQQGRRQKIGQILIGQILIDQELIDEDKLLSALAAKFTLQRIDLTGMTPTHEALNVLSEEMVRRFQVLPLEIEANRPVDEITALALEKGMRSLRMDGLQKVLAGHTTEAEIMKVCV